MTGKDIPRLIPVLLVRDGGLVKTIRFKDGKYVGDPMNAIRIFNDLRVDEIILLDISASREQRGPDFELLREVAQEAFMPFCYGGGIRTLEDARKIFQIGIEKIAVNHAAANDPTLLRRVADEYGEQAVVGAMDVKHGALGGTRLYDHVTGKRLRTEPLEHAQMLQDHGAGEIFVNWVDRDGVMEGYDTKLITQLSSQLRVPLIVCGGAGTWDDLPVAAAAGADAVAAGSLFVFRGKRRGVLINYPPPEEIERIFGHEPPL